MAIRMYKRNTTKFEATVGTAAGYNFDNSVEYMGIDRFAELLDEISTRVEKDTGIYISWEIYPSITVYKKEWGCPTGGEHTYHMMAVRNPIFAENENEDIWIDTCIEVLHILQQRLEQSTVTATITSSQRLPNVQMYYFRDEK